MSGATTFGWGVAQYDSSGEKGSPELLSPAVHSDEPLAAAVAASLTFQHVGEGSVGVVCVVSWLQHLWLHVSLNSSPQWVQTPTKRSPSRFFFCLVSLCSGETCCFSSRQHTHTGHYWQIKHVQHFTIVVRGPEEKVLTLSPPGDSVSPRLYVIMFASFYLTACFKLLQRIQILNASL